MFEYQVNYYAQLREQRGLSEEHVMSDAKDLLGLYDELKMKNKFSLFADDIKFAVNDEMICLDIDKKYVLSSGDKIVFIPPVAGG